MPIRQFLYVDVDRARSYLAQLDEGVVETITSRSDSEFRSGVSARLLGLGAEVGAAGTTAVEESRSLQDLSYALFEKAAETAGLILDLDDLARSPENWESSALHDTLGEGQIVRITSDIQSLDPLFFTARLERLRTFAQAMVELNLGSKLQSSSQQKKTPQTKPSQRDRERLFDAALREMWGGTDPQSVEHISKILTSLTSGEIALRVVPCGWERPELSFGGVLLARSEYMQKEREALFSRFGSILSGWTAVMQVEAVPYPTTEQPALSQNVMLSDAKINRAGVEKLCLDFLRLLDSTGLTEGPQWPSITVTPLALYRQVALAP